MADVIRAAEPLSQQWAAVNQKSVEANERVRMKAIPYVFWAVVLGIICLTVVVCLMAYLQQAEKIPAALAAVAGVVGIFFAGRASKG